MSGGPLQFRILTTAWLVCLAITPCLAGQAHHRVKKPEAIPAPVTPIVPLTPAQMPATPSTVAFKAGQLTVTAPNSTLGDILREVRKQTGASIDIPGNATERVMGVFGPGPVRDVLSTILNGSHFNYVLLGSATDPNALDRVVLFAKTTAAPANQQTTAQAQTQPPPAPAPGAQAFDFGNGDDSADTQPDANDIFGNADDQNQAQADDQQQGEPNPFGAPGNGVKTPQQLLQELQQQQQQQQQGQNPNPTFPGGPRFRPGGIPPGMQPQQPNQSDPQQ